MASAAACLHHAPGVSVIHSATRSHLLQYTSHCQTKEAEKLDSNSMGICSGTKTVQRFSSQQEKTKSDANDGQFLINQARTGREQHGLGKPGSDATKYIVKAQLQSNAEIHQVLSQQGVLC